MLVNRLKSALIATASAGALFVGLGTGPAAAGVLTWSPAGAGLTTTGSTNITGFDSFNIQDFARITLPSQPTCLGCTVSGITENAFLIISDFNVLSPGLQSALGNGGVPTTDHYQLYFEVTATSHLTLVPGPLGDPTPDLQGAFDTLTYNFWGDTGGDCVFNITAGVPTRSPACGTQTLLGTGSLDGGTNEVSIIDGVPGASVTVTFAPNLAESGFFVVPPASDLHILLQTAFINTSGSTTTDPPGGCPAPPTGCTFVLGAGAPARPGGGNATIIETPEPASVALFGMGLLGLGFMFRRRNEIASKS